MAGGIFFEPSKRYISKRIKKIPKRFNFSEGMVKVVSQPAAALREK